MANSDSKKEPHFGVSTWEPDLVESFLEVHGFIWVDMDGDDTLWIGKTPEGKDAQVAFPRMRRELTPGTMKHSVMRHSGYDQKHWDLWRSLRKTRRKRKFCCTSNNIQVIDTSESSL